MGIILSLALVPLICLITYGLEYRQNLRYSKSQRTEMVHFDGTGWYTIIDKD